MIDMHIHSICSDGTNSVDELLELTKDFNYFSITDHDSTESAKYILNNGLNRPNYTTGVEFSTRDLDDSIHILFYNFNPFDKRVDEVLDSINSVRVKRLTERLDILKNDYNITLDKKDLDYLYSLENPTRPNIAQILIRMGLAKDIDDAFKKYLFHKLQTRKPESVDVIKKLQEIGGVIVFAHPLGGIGEKEIELDVLEDRINRFIQAGLDGLECCYSLYDSRKQAILLDLAKKNNLYISGGSDYHGKNKTVKLLELSSDGTDNTSEINIFKYIK